MSAPPTLRCDAVGARYGARRVLEGVDLALAPGSVTAILGPNGSGKTTLLRLLAGLLAPTAGRVLLGERPLDEIPRRELARAVALVGVEPEIPFAWTALEIVLMGRAPHLAAGRLEGAAEIERARAALARLDAAPLAHRAITELSAGERQRVLLARGLCQQTPALLLDEPTSHLDPAHALRLASILRELAADGRAIAWVAHDLNLAARGADRLVFLRHGRVAAAGSPDEVLTEATIRQVFGVGGRRVEGPPPAFLPGEGSR